MNFSAMPKDELRELASKAGKAGGAAGNGSKRKASCKYGHPLSGNNLLTYQTRVKVRGTYYPHVRHKCKECAAIYSADYWERKRYSNGTN